MLTTIDEGSAEITADFEIRWRVVLEPGVWVMDHRGQKVSVTSLYGTRRDDTFYIAFPKGSARRAGGTWSLQERILADVLPDDPIQAWSQIPEQIRSAIEDAYLLSRHELPEQVGPS